MGEVSSVLPLTFKNSEKGGGKVEKIAWEVPRLQSKGKLNGTHHTIFVFEFQEEKL